MIGTNILQNLNYGQIYQRNEIIELIKMDNDFSDNYCVEIIGELVNIGLLQREGRNRYILANKKQKDEYIPEYSKSTLNILDKITKRFNDIQFIVFESRLLNEFLNQLIANNTLFIYVEKDAIDIVFDYLKNEQKLNVLYKPSASEYSRYWTKDCVVLLELKSESPLNKENSHFITMEKLLVDLYCDKLLKNIYSFSEYLDIFKQVYENYFVNTTKMLRYARRRNKQEEIFNYYLLKDQDDI